MSKSIFIQQGSFITVVVKDSVGNSEWANKPIEYVPISEIEKLKAENEKLKVTINKLWETIEKQTIKIEKYLIFEKLKERGE